MENTRNKLVDAEQLIESQDKLVKDLEESIVENSYSKAVPPPSKEPSPGAGLQLVEKAQLGGAAGASAATAPETATTKSSAIHTEEDTSDFEQECAALRQKVQLLECENAQLQVCWLR